MKEKIESIKKKALDMIDSAKVLKDIDDIRVSFLGKKGEITELMKTLKDLTQEEKREAGMIINEAKSLIEDGIHKKMDIFREEALNLSLQNEKIDVSLPSKKISLGHYHPIT
ncbi:MAG: phenylalanine--tRNA ligase subunit alpha, partial [Lachnospiraceae bacterium]|nr:phenylalanine--tRNA ligase subunit alpha [Lachnospiraceae bacterium]